MAREPGQPPFKVVDPIQDFEPAPGTHRLSSLDEARQTRSDLARYTLILNERAKLFANCLNAIASGTAIIGTVTPIVAWFFKLAAAPELAPGRLLLGALIWLIVAACVHVLASLVLGVMRAP